MRSAESWSQNPVLRYDDETETFVHSLLIVRCHPSLVSACKERSPMHITLDSRGLLSRFFLLTPVFLVLSSLALPQAKPPIDRKLASGAGQSAQQAVQVPFEPVLLDANGHPIQPVREPEPGSADADVHPLSPNARKEKALADSHK